MVEPNSEEMNNDETSVSESNGCDSRAKLSDMTELSRSCQDSSLGDSMAIVRGGETPKPTDAKSEQRDLGSCQTRSGDIPSYEDAGTI